MSTPTLDRPPVSNGQFHEPPVRRPIRGAPSRGVVLVATVAAFVAALATLGVLAAIGALGRGARATSVVSEPVIRSSSTNAPFNAAGIYRAAAPGVVDITATGGGSSSDSLPFTPPDQQQSTATGTGTEVDT